MSDLALADFGTFVIGSDVDAAVIDCLVEWFPTYVVQFERERGLTVGTLALPRRASYVAAFSPAEYMDNSTPSLIVNTSAIVTQPVVMAGNVDTAFWRTVITSIVRGKNQPATKVLVSAYAGLVYRCLRQQLTRMRGVATDLRLAAMSYTAVPDTTGAGRWLASGIGEYVVGTDVVVTGDNGPTVPDVGPYHPLATVTEIDVDLETLLTGDG